MKIVQRFIEQQCIGYRHTANKSESWFREVVLYTDGTTGTQYRASISERNGFTYIGGAQENPPIGLIPN